MAWALISYNSGKALDVPSGDQANGLPLQQYTYNHGPNQLWDLQPTTPDSAAFRIVSQATGKALTVSPVRSTWRMEFGSSNGQSMSRPAARNGACN